MHWLLAGLILFQLGLGFYQVNLVASAMRRFELTQLHKGVGFVVFVLVLARIGWRLANRAPELPERMGSVERRLARANHLALYALMLAAPLTGWLMASASPLNDADAVPFQIRNMVFGLFALPDPVQPGDQALSDAFWWAHTGAAVLMVVLVLGHVAAAIKHQSIDRDGLVRRMILG